VSDVKTNDNRREFIHTWRPRDVDGIELYSARLLSHSYGKHFHEEYTIGINDGGLGSFWCHGTNQIAGPRTLNLLAPGEVHTGAAAGIEGWTYRNIYLAPSLVERIARQLDAQQGGLPHFCQSIARDDRVWSTMDQAFRVLNSRSSRLELDTVLLVSLRLLLDRFADWQPAPWRVAKHTTAVAKARRYLEERYGDDVSLDELAGVAGLSPHYLIRCFQKEVGLPPHAYQLQLRLQRAKADLRSDSSLSDVAVKHGFFDQSHFHRHFKRTFGVTPGQYCKGNFVQDA
jgi:AraC-like DNA-binding protein